MSGFMSYLAYSCDSHAPYTSHIMYITTYLIDFYTTHHIFTHTSPHTHTSPQQTYVCMAYSVTVLLHCPGSYCYNQDSIQLSL